MDPRLLGQYSVKGAKEMAVLALHCVSMNPKDRPRMATVVDTLEGLQQFKDMAVTSGHWPAASKSTRNSNNGASKNVKGRGGANQKKPSPIVPTKKT